MADSVNHPSHYTSHPSGVECITITEHMNFNVGNAIKYLWRAGLKLPIDVTPTIESFTDELGFKRMGLAHPKHHITDLEKARWYIDREIQRLVGDKK